MYTLLKLNQTVVILEYKTLQDQYSQSCKYQKAEALLQTFPRTYEKILSSLLSPDLLPVFIPVKEHKLDFNSLRERDGCPVSHSQLCHHQLLATCPQAMCDQELKLVPCSHRKAVFGNKLLMAQHN